MLKKCKDSIRYMLLEAWLPPDGSMDKTIGEQFDGKECFFIQVGSNDGILSDGLHEFIEKNNWHGILVEPVREIFEKLKSNYKHKDNLIFENSAITEKTGTCKFYRLKENKEKMPIWYTQIGSLLPEVILEHKARIPTIEKHLVIEEVPCITLPDLKRKHEVKKVDFLFIDAEGYDFQIINSLDFETIDPKLIIFEHKTIYFSWLPRYRRSFLQYMKCLRRLKSHGYAVFKDHGDTIAVKP